MAKIGLKSGSGRKGGVSSSLKCKTCKTIVKNVDSLAVSVVCHKCVSRSINPYTIFVDELSQEEWDTLRRKQS